LRLVCLRDSEDEGLSDRYGLWLVPKGDVAAVLHVKDSLCDDFDRRRWMKMSGLCLWGGDIEKSFIELGLEDNRGLAEIEIFDEWGLPFLVELVCPPDVLEVMLGLRYGIAFGGDIESQSPANIGFVGLATEKGIEIQAAFLELWNLKADCTAILVKLRVSYRGP